MKKTKTYRRVRFKAETIASALATFLNLIPRAHRKGLVVDWHVTFGDESFRHASEHEFFADYRRSPTAATVSADSLGSDWRFRVQMLNPLTVLVEVQSTQRSEVEAVFAVFEQSLEAAAIAEPTIAVPTIFIGHGRSAAWRDLKDHLQDKHGFPIEAYETGARAGRTITDVLDGMLQSSSFALLVLTAEDDTANGPPRARSNVIHELGLFQGRLGFRRAIALLEEGTDEFSNLQGTQQLRFKHGRIAEVFGDVLATVKREFGLSAV